jgi:hypothetical protein
LRGGLDQKRWASYANGMALKLAVRLIDPRTRFLMTLHMDTMPCRAGWLSFLCSKIDKQVKAAGVRVGTARTAERVLHVLGYLVDFQVFQQLGLDFLLQLPQYDVGDRVTVALREAGYQVFACPDTLWEPIWLKRFQLNSHYASCRWTALSMRPATQIFLHLGRGVRKSVGDQRKGTTAEAWIQVAKEHLLLTAQHE